MSVLSYTKRDFIMLTNIFKMGLRDRFLGSALGMIWAIVNPLLMLAIFTFIFGFVFKSKLPGAETSLAYVIWLISGYGPWLAISEGITASTTSVTTNSSMIKNMVFKSELLPMAYSLLAIIPLVVSIVYLGILLVVNSTPITWHYVLILPILLLQFTFIAGLGFFLSAMNVYLRDVAFVLPNILLILLFATPIFYSIDSFPAVIQGVARLNPFYIISEGYRQPILYHHAIPLWQMLYLATLSAALFISGLMFFKHLKTYFDSQL